MSEETGHLKGGKWRAIYTYFFLEGRILGLLCRRFLQEKNEQSDSWGKSGLSPGLFSVKIDRIKHVNYHRSKCAFPFVFLIIET